LVWDLLFLEGAGILFKAGLVFLYYLKPKIIAVQEFSKDIPYIFLIESFR